MIALIKGILVHKTPESAVIDVHGVGYRLLIPLSTFYKLPEDGDSVSLHTYTCVREDALNLYGFMTTTEKELFEKLISVSKVGPRLGLNLISGLPVEELRAAIANKDVMRLSSIPGVGIKTAERLILELKDKIGLIADADAKGVPGTLNREEARIMDDVILALINLGYKKKDAERSIRAIWDGGERNIEALIRECLSRLAR